MSDASPAPETAATPEAAPPDMAAILAAQAAERAQAEAEAQAEREQAEAEAAAVAADLAARTIAKAGGFGPTFPAELIAAGFDLGALPFSILLAGVLVAPGVTRAVRSKIAAVVTAHKRDAVPPALLPALTDRQFGEGLWRDGLISFEEYIGFVGPGVVPPPLLAIIETLPDDDTGGPTPRKVALGLVTGAQEYRFDNPLVDLVRQAKGWTVDHLRERWAAWATL